MTTARFSGAKNTENTYVGLRADYQLLAYAASIACVVKQGVAETLFQIAALTGALSLTINVGSATLDPQVGDVAQFLFLSDASIRVITFSTGFKTAGTLSTVASKKAFISFMFDGTDWVEQGRAICA